MVGLNFFVFALIFGLISTATASFVSDLPSAPLIPIAAYLKPGTMYDYAIIERPQLRITPLYHKSRHDGIDAGAFTVDLDEGEGAMIQRRSSNQPTSTSAGSMYSTNGSQDGSASQPQPSTHQHSIQTILSSLETSPNSKIYGSKKSSVTPPKKQG